MTRRQRVGVVTAIVLVCVGLYTVTRVRRADPNLPPTRAQAGFMADRPTKRMAPVDAKPPAEGAALAARVLDLIQQSLRTEGLVDCKADVVCQRRACTVTLIAGACIKDEDRALEAMAIAQLSDMATVGPGPANRDSRPVMMVRLLEVRKEIR